MPKTSSVTHAKSPPAQEPAGSGAGAANTPPLPLPHERDESSTPDGDNPRAIINQAKKDLDAGLVDTDMRSTPGMDSQRRDALLRRER